MIPRPLKTRLLENEEIKKLLVEHDVRDKFNKGFCDALATKILDAVEKNVIKDKDLIKKVRTKKSHEGQVRTLDRMLNDDRHRCALKSYQMILIYLDIHKNHWKSLLDWSAETTDEHRYLGAYYLYRYNLSRNSEIIVRTVIRLLPGDSGKMKVEYYSLDDKVFGGVAFLKDNILTITIAAEKSIEISAGIPSKHIAKENFLHAIIRSSRNGMPYTKNAIMAFKGEGMLTAESNKIVPVYHTSAFKDKDFKPPLPYESTKDIDHIAEFLGRKMKELNANPFTIATIKDLTDRNMKAHRKEKPGFSIIAETLEKKYWYSISSYQPSPGYICINSFTFEINELTKEVLFDATLYEEDGPITIKGYAEFFRNQYVFKMSRKKMHEYSENRVLMYSIGKYCHDDQIRASTTLFLQRKELNLNVKEIFFRSAEALKETKIAYQEFLDSELISNFDKHIVLSNYQLQNWHAVDKERIAKFNHLENFADDWFAYIPNAYSEADRSLLQLTISIDKLGFTKEKIVCKKPRKPKLIETNYAGIAEIYHEKKLMRLINRTDDDQASAYIFDIKDKEEYDGYLTGVTLDNDVFDAACADFVVIIRQPALVKFEKKWRHADKPASPVSASYAPQILETNSYHYDLVKAYLNKEAAVDLEKYFFGKFQSIRQDRPK